MIKVQTFSFSLTIGQVSSVHRMWLADALSPALQTSVPKAKQLQPRVEALPGHHNSRWRRLAACGDPVWSGAWAAPIVPREFNALPADRTEESSASHSLSGSDCSRHSERHLSILWSQNTTFLCFWTKLGLLQLAQMTASRRTLTGDQPREVAYLKNVSF